MSGNPNQNDGARRMGPPTTTNQPNYTHMQYLNPYAYSPYGYYYGYNIPAPFYAANATYYPQLPARVPPYGQPPATQPVPQTQQPVASHYNATWWKNSQQQRESMRKPPPPPPPPPPPSRSQGVSLSLNRPSLVQKNQVPDIFQKETSLDVKKEPKPVKKELPESLKNYVRQSFKACDSELQKDEMEIQFRDLINKVLEDGTAFTVDWAKEPLMKPKQFPQQKSGKRNRKRHNNRHPKFQKKMAENGAAPLASINFGPIDTNKVNERKLRFHDAEPTRLAIPLTSKPIAETASPGTILGTSTALEKVYLRLTTAPDPSSVRPPEMLEKSFAYVMKKWEENSNYHYLSEQLKSIRQDLTIQAVKTQFTVQVYEKNGRIALQMGDREEFNQCQTVLKELYRSGVPGNTTEFQVYNILYLTYTLNHTELANLLTCLSDAEMDDRHVRLAISLYKAYTCRNFVKFFQLYRRFDMIYAKALIDIFIDKMRLFAFKATVASYLPKVPLSFLANCMGFDAVDELEQWLQKQNIQLESSEPQNHIDCKAVRAMIANLNL